MSLRLVLELLGLTLAFYLVRTVYERLRRRRDFKNLPGPKPSSFSTGCLVEYDALDGIGFHKDLTKTYGSAATLMGPLGVSPTVSCCFDIPKFERTLRIPNFTYLIPVGSKTYSSSSPMPLKNHSMSSTESPC